MVLLGPSMDATNATFSLNRASLWLLVLVGAIGLTISVAVADSFSWVAGFGIAFVVLGGAMGCFRTGRFFTWQAPIEPNWIEGILGCSGAALVVAALVGLFVRPLVA